MNQILWGKQFYLNVIETFHIPDIYRDVIYFYIYCYYFILFSVSI